MTKANYLELIKEIGKAVRENNIRYGRVFSDKRKSTGYRTKFWWVFGGNTKEVVAIAKLIGGNAINVTCVCRDVIITPVELF